MENSGRKVRLIVARWRLAAIRGGATLRRELRAMPTRPVVLAMFVVACFGSISPGVAESFDGSYVGERSLTKGDPSACVDKDAVSVTIHDGTLTFTDSSAKNYTISFSPHSDGSFAEQSANIGGAVVDIRGRITGGVLDSDVTSAYCVHHWHLEKR
jgi:hypothetical protein